MEPVTDQTQQQNDQQQLPPPASHQQLQIHMPEPGEVGSVFSDEKTFNHGQRVAKMLCSSNLVPEIYKNNMANTLIALEMATRIGASPLMVMQNLFVIQGKPSWSSPFIIAALNSCKRFRPLKFLMGGEGDEYGCTAWTFEIGSKEKLEGPKVTWAMVKAEGWLSKSGSKWKTMPELMFRYRAAAFFGRLYAPDVLMGMHTDDEVQEFSSAVSKSEPNSDLKDAIAMLENATNQDEFQVIIDSFPELENNPEFQKNLVYFQRKNIK